MSVSVPDFQHFQGVHDRCLPVYCSFVRAEAGDAAHVDKYVGCSVDVSTRRRISYGCLPVEATEVMDGGPPSYSCSELRCGEGCADGAGLQCGADERLCLC